MDPPFEGLDAALTDPAVRARVVRFVDRSLYQAEYIMDFGTRAERANLIKSAVPGLMKSLNKQEANERDAALRAEHEQIRAMVRGYLTPTLYGDEPPPAA